VDDHEDAIKDRFRTYSGELNLLLWIVWKPIGFDVPLTEYESYVPTIWRLLEERAGTDAIEAELARISSESMGIEATTNLDAAEAAGRWWYWRFDYPEELAGPGK